MGLCKNVAGLSGWAEQLKEHNLLSLAQEVVTEQDGCLQADICQLGMDQRKVNMLAREYCDKIKRKLKPVILSHEMLPGLLEVCITASQCTSPPVE